MADVDDAYEAALEAQREWAAALPVERASVMRAAAEIVVTPAEDEIVGWLIREGGGTYAKSELERRRSVERAARSRRRFLTTSRDGSCRRTLAARRAVSIGSPVGVVAVISPWNFPMYLTNRSVAPALAVGNAVVLKPATDTPVTGGLLLAKIYEEAGLPARCAQRRRRRRSGDRRRHRRRTPSRGSCRSPDRHPVGRAIPGKAGLKRLALELGGNGPMVVLDDADVELAVDAAVFGAFFHQGQICMIANRLIVDKSIHDDFVERFVERVRPSSSSAIRAESSDRRRTDHQPRPARLDPGQAPARPERRRPAAARRRA